MRMAQASQILDLENEKEILEGRLQSEFDAYGVRNTNDSFRLKEKDLKAICDLMAEPQYHGDALLEQSTVSSAPDVPPPEEQLVLFEMEKTFARKPEPIPWWCVKICQKKTGAFERVAFCKGSEDADEAFLLVEVILQPYGANFLRLRRRPYCFPAVEAGVVRGEPEICKCCEYTMGNGYLDERAVPFDIGDDICIMTGTKYVDNTVVTNYPAEPLECFLSRRPP